MATSITNNPLHSLKDQLSVAVGSCSVVVKIIACAVTVGYLLSFITPAIPFLTVTPGYVMPPNARVHSFATFCFVELHFWHVIADILVLVLCGKLLEPLWGAPDLILFFIIVNLGVGLMTAVQYITAYFLTLNADLLFDVHIHGLAGYIAGFCVAVKQVMPDYSLANMPFGKLRNTHIPLTLLVLVILLRAFGALPAHYPYMFGWGIVVSWLYLRFYQKHTNGNRGDMGDSFSFASFFPNHLQPMITVLSNTLFNLLVRVRVCRKPQRRYDFASPSTITLSLPGTQLHDAHRRKQLALKALDNRLQNTDVDLDLPWPAPPDPNTDIAIPLTPPTPQTPVSTPPTLLSTPPTLLSTTPVYASSSVQQGGSSAVKGEEEGEGERAGQTGETAATAQS